MIPVRTSCACAQHVRTLPLPLPGLEYQAGRAVRALPPWGRYAIVGNTITMSRNSLLRDGHRRCSGRPSAAFPLFCMARHDVMMRRRRPLVFFLPAVFFSAKCRGAHLTRHKSTTTVDPTQSINQPNRSLPYYYHVPFQRQRQHRSCSPLRRGLRGPGRCRDGPPKPQSSGPWARGGGSSA